MSYTPLPHQNRKGTSEGTGISPNRKKKQKGEKGEEV
jgi:hypothetical protein